MTKEILFRAIMEVMGKPAEHVEKALKQYLDNLKKDGRFKVISEEIAPVEKREKEELWTTFAEVEVKTKDISNLINFCLEFMPSVIEIIEPEEITFKDVEVTSFVNDLQSRLHQVDMLAKQLKTENDILHKSIGDLLGNYILLLLSQQNHDSETLSRLTGVEKSKLEDFLDILIDKGKIDLKEGIYFLKKEKKEEKKRQH